MLNRRSFFSLAAMAGLTSARAQTQAAAPAGTDWQWTDPARQRSLPLRLHRPAGQGPWPLVLFSHGLGGDLDAGRDWAEAWAQAGIATLNLQHPGSDVETLRSGGMAALREAANGHQLGERCKDLRFVLDELSRRQPGEPALQALRLDALGVAGHSFGARSTLALAGQQFGLATRWDDPRPRAFAAFSPSPGKPGVDNAAMFGRIERPMLCLSGSLDTDPLGLASVGEPSRRARGDWRRGVYEALPPGDKAELWLDGADHASFAGQSGRAWTRRNRPEAALAQTERHRALIADASSRWWQAQLLGDAAARASLARPPAQLSPQDAWRRA